MRQWGCIVCENVGVSRLVAAGLQSACVVDMSRGLSRHV